MWLASWFCKAATSNPFNLLAKDAKKALLKASTFHEAKYMPRPYQAAEALLKSYSQQQDYSSWNGNSPRAEDQVWELSNLQSYHTFKSLETVFQSTSSFPPKLSETPLFNSVCDVITG